MPKPFDFFSLQEQRGLPVRDYTERKLYQNFHSRFATACGIALQGIDRAAFAVNLLPPRTEKKFLGMFSRKKKMPTAAWGFDFGHSCVRAVRLFVDEDDVIAVDQCFHMHHPFDGPRSDGTTQTLADLTDAQVAAAVSNTTKETMPNPFQPAVPDVGPSYTDAQDGFFQSAIETFLMRYEYRGETIGVGYPSHDVLSTNIRLPTMPPQLLTDALAHAAKSFMPESLFLHRIYHLLLGAEEIEAMGEQQYFHYFAIKNRTIENLLETLGKYGIEPAVMTTNVLANLSYGYYLSASPVVSQPGETAALLAEPSQKTEAGTLLICDMGTLGTDIIFYDMRNIHHSYLQIGGQEFTAQLARELGESFMAAEGIKRDPVGRSGNPAAVAAALKPTAQRFIRELKLRLTHFCGSQPIKIDSVMVLGGGFMMKGFANYFRSILASSLQD